MLRAEPARAERTAPAAAPPAATPAVALAPPAGELSRARAPWTPGHALRLQRAVGNAAASRLLVAPPGEARRWSLAYIDEERGRLEDSFEGEVALHHIVSKDELGKVAAKMGAFAGYSGVKATKWAESKTAASTFLTAVANAWKASVPAG